MIYGTSWYKVDFHCHSPASDDYKEKEISERDWLLSYMNSGIDAIVLSDHNTGNYVDKAKEALDVMRRECESGEENGYRPLKIFPGVELTATGNIHVLGVFPESYTSENIAGVVGACGKVPDSKNHVLVLRAGVEHCISHIKEAGGIAIPAHIDRPKGLFASEKNLEAIRQVFSGSVDAVELKGDFELVDKQKSKFIEKIPLVIGSDAHERNVSGSSYTWVKMSEINFSGLKTALADHEYSIIRSGYGTPPQTPYNWIDNISIKTKTCSNSGNPVTVGFSPWYSSIIGSRGSGKSTVVEYIRYALSLGEKLPKDIHGKYTNFIQKTVDEASTIELSYYKDSQKFLVKSSPLEQVVEVKGLDGNIEKEKLSIQRFPVSIYSQKMLFEIANASNAFLKIVDESKEVAFENWELEFTVLVDGYSTLFSQKERIINQCKRLADLNSEYKDISLSIEQVKNSNYSKIIQTKERIDKEFSYLDQFTDHVHEILDEIESTSEQDVDFFEPEYELDPASQKWVSDAKEITQQLKDDLGALVKEAKEKVEGLFKVSPYVDNVNAIIENNDAMEECIASLTDNGTPPERLIELVKTKGDLADEKAKLASAPDKLVNVQAEITDKHNEIIEKRKELTAMRQAFIDSLEIDNLKVKVLPLGEPGKELITNYQDVVGFESFNDHILDLDQKKGIFSDFISIEKRAPKVEGKVYQKLAEIKGLHDLSVEKLKAKGLHASFAKKLGELKSERVKELNSWFPNDGISIQFKRDDGSWANLEDASPGQQSASMLSFLLSYGDEPIIIDQPEDDLDCAMLSSNVIPNIRKNKSRRQLILVTHSAPLVVNGDAENVISMKFDKGKVTVGKMGAIQESDMKELICKQMEGGKDAFKSRYSRLTT